jgi:hypothetical protein
MQGSQHDDPSRDAEQLQSGVILSRETGNLRSVPSRATTPSGGGKLATQPTRILAHH